MADDLSKSGGDTLDGLMRIRHEFLRAGLKVPPIILLQDHDEGMRFWMQLTQKNYVMIPINQPGASPADILAPDGTVWKEIDVMGMKVRWPATPYKLPTGATTRAY